MIKIDQYIRNLVEKYKYKPLPEELSVMARQFYKENLPFLDPLISIKDKNCIEISHSFERIVIGDYGAFIEFSEAQSNSSIFYVPSNQKFRLSKGFYGKYIWLSTDGINKIYKQIKTVSYADYKVGRYYISPYDIVQ